MVTLSFMPYSEIEDLSSLGRIRKLLNEAKENKIVLLQGRLKKEEETELIKATMEEINKDFKGIELAVIDPHSAQSAGVRKFKNAIFGMLLGDRQGMTIIGPASIVKEIKKDPTKIELLTKESNSKKRKTRSRKKKKR
ncbi:DUF2073 domain-containing protein [Candidatus Woesearchaeota archaeon]|nr:DUF2073 domain-containing protein [Candidatus Woesearchaeota archaeon]